MDVMRNL